mgnify:CR=1 FL=1
MSSRSRLLSPILLLLLLLPSCSKDLQPVSVYIVTYTLETQGSVTITSAQYLAPDGKWTDVPANQTNWADFFTFPAGSRVGFRATGSIAGAGMIRMTAQGSSTNNMLVDLSDTATGTSGTTLFNLDKTQLLQ